MASEKNNRKSNTSEFICRVDETKDMFHWHTIKFTKYFYTLVFRFKTQFLLKCWLRKLIRHKPIVILGYFYLFIYFLKPSSRAKMYVELKYDLYESNFHERYCIFINILKFCGNIHAGEVVLWNYRKFASVIARIFFFLVYNGNAEKIRMPKLCVWLESL